MDTHSGGIYALVTAELALPPDAVDASQATTPMGRRGSVGRRSEFRLAHRSPSEPQSSPGSKGAPSPNASNRAIVGGFESTGGSERGAALSQMGTSTRSLGVYESHFVWSASVVSSGAGRWFRWLSGFLRR